MSFKKIRLNSVEVEIRQCASCYFSDVKADEIAEGYLNALGSRQSALFNLDGLLFIQKNLSIGEFHILNNDLKLILSQIEKTGFYTGDASDLNGEVINGCFTKTELANQSYIQYVLPYTDESNNQKNKELLERLKLIAESSESVTTLYTVDGKPEYISPNSFKILGYSSEEQIRLPSYEGVEKEYLKGYLDYVNDIKAGKPRASGYEFQFKKHNGDLIWLKIVMHPICNENGDVVKIQASTTDISRDKEYELKLKESQRQSEAIINSSESAILLIDKSYKVISVNDRAKVLSLQLFNTPTTTGADIHEILPPLNLKNFKPYFEKALKGESSNFYRRFVFGNNSEFWFLIKYIPVWQNDGKIHSVTWIATDITDEKKSEEYTINVLQRLSLANSAGGIGIWDYNFEKNTVKFDDQCLNLFHKQVGVRISLPRWAQFYEYKSKSKLLTAFDKSASELKKQFELELELKTPLGKVQYHKLKGVIQFKDGLAFKAIGVLLDVTDSKLTENKLLRNKDQLSKAQVLARMGDFEFDLDSKNTYWSENNFALHGISNKLVPSLLKYFKSISLNTERKQLIKAIKDATRSDKTQECIINYSTNNKKITLNYRIKGVFYRNKLRKIVGTVQDISNDISLQKSLAQKSELLSKNQERISQYSFVNSHKVRAPLSNVLGIIQLLRLEYNEELLEMLEKSADELDKVIHEVNTLLAE